eukprot:2004824-Pleurochrysis_carterae.AAC.1
MRGDLACGVRTRDRQGIGLRMALREGASGLRRGRCAPPKTFMPTTHHVMKEKPWSQPSCAFRQSGMLRRHVAGKASTENLAAVLVITGRRDND